MSTSFEALDSLKDEEALIKEDAIVNCSENKWCSLFHTLALSSVIKRKIIIHYPDHGGIKFRTLFNQKISPRSTCESSYCINILCCYEGLPLKGIFNHNHYVPLAFKAKSSIKRALKRTETGAAKKIKIEPKNFQLPKQSYLFGNL